MNAQEHRFVSAATLGALGGTIAPTDEERLPYAAAGCAGGYCLGTVPDLIEPASHPHHRQFFHGWLFAGALAYGVYRLYRWEPETTDQKFWRAVGLIAGAAYLVHLAMDATTKGSLPLVGRLS